MELREMELREVVMTLGGVATFAELRESFSTREIAAAVSAGDIHRVARGRYVIHVAKDHQRVAQSMSGTLAVTNAALHHGWPVAHEPDRPWVSLPRNRKVTPAMRSRAHIIHTAARGRATPPLQTVLDAARHLPFPDALAIADSALRCGDVGIVELLAAAQAARGPGAGVCRRVAELATPLAASPLESVLRALCLDIGLRVRPQMAVNLPTFIANPDLVDEELRIIVEGDTWLHHGSTPEKFNRDVERYTLLSSHGWLVLRFLWKQAMDDPDFVRDCLTRSVDLRRAA